MEEFKIGKWGNSLAIRLPSKLVKRMGLREGILLPPETLSHGALLRAGLQAERERNKMTQAEGLASIREGWKSMPKDIKPEDWKIDRNDPDMRG
jgi:antitoxin component of MazEF toxin-antitoxin module